MATRSGIGGDHHARAEAGREGTRPLIVVSASLDNLGVADVRRLQEAQGLGRVYVRVSSDGLVAARTGRAPAFPQAERLFLARSLRYVDGASVVHGVRSVTRPVEGERPSVVLVGPFDDDPELRDDCERRGITHRLIRAGDPVEPSGGDLQPTDPSARRVVVTGCFDWLHSGHVQFFLEAATLGELYVVVGSDRNVRHLKGPGHPLRGQEERRYMVQAVRAVHAAEISTGHGWMDAEPEIASIAPHVYVVNEDGDQPEKRDFCRARGLEYVVLRRRPHRGLPQRTSTGLRGF